MRRAVIACALVLALAFAVPFHALAARSQTTGNSGEVASTPVTAVPLTMAIWFRSAVATTAVQDVFSIRNGSGNYFLLEARGDLANDPVLAYTYNTTTAAAANSLASLQNDTWHHCCGAYATAAQRSIFLDGGGRADNTVSCVPSGLNTVSVGTAGEGVEVNGSVAYAAIWSYDLEVAGIVSLAAGQNPITGPHADKLVFFAPLDGAGSIEADVVGQRALTVGNGVAPETKPGMLLR